MDKQQLNILAAVSLKAAAELVKTYAAGLTGEEMVEEVNLKARRIFENHRAWLAELYKAEADKQINEAPK